MNKPESFLRVVDSIKKLPGIGSKSAEKIAYQLLDLSKEDRENVYSSIKNMSESIKSCSLCGCLMEYDNCPICDDINRDKSVICVVDRIKDVYAIENTNNYKGLYHVLGGTISPSKGIMPEDLRINELLDRIDSNIKEIILANGTSMDGETTALFISKLLSNKNIIVSRLGYGIPMGTQLEYADEFTLSKAFESRKKID